MESEKLETKAEKAEEICSFARKIVENSPIFECVNPSGYNCDHQFQVHRVSYCHRYVDAVMESNLRRTQ